MFRLVQCRGADFKRILSTEKPGDGSVDALRIDGGDLGLTLFVAVFVPDSDSDHAWKNREGFGSVKQTAPVMIGASTKAAARAVCV
jgi:hypothetical protein